MSAATLTPEGHETKPPARYTEATLIKELEDREIGRPSTYASIIGTILNRGYVYKKGTALVPAWLAFSVVRLLEEHFPRQVSYEFTASMEDVLDEIAGGRKDRATELGEFYYGAGDVVGLKTLVTELGDIDAKEIATFPIGARTGSTCASAATARTSRGRRPRTATARPCGPTSPTTCRPTSSPSLAKELLANPAGEEQVVGNHPDTGLQVVAKNGRFGPYVTEVLPEDAPKSAKPRTGSLFKSMSLDTVSLEEAVKLLDLPRVVGADEDGNEITAQNGRYGPYLKKGTDSRSLTSEDQIFDITLDQAQGDLRPAQAARPWRGHAAAQGARQRPGLRAAGRREGGPLRRVRHRRRVQRHPAQGRHRRGDHPRARRRAARRASRARPGQEGGQEGREEGAGQEDRRRRRRPPRRPLRRRRPRRLPPRSPEALPSSQGGEA